MEEHSFHRAWNDSPETLRKLWVSTKFPHQEIRRYFGILRSDTDLQWFRYEIQTPHNSSSVYLKISCIFILGHLLLFISNQTTSRDNLIQPA